MKLVGLAVAAAAAFVINARWTKADPGPPTPALDDRVVIAAPVQVGDVRRRQIPGRQS